VNQTEWKDVGSLVMALIGRQPVPMQIFSWLLIAFALLMLVEGLRATFLPRRVVAQIRRREPLETDRRLHLHAPAPATSSSTETAPRRLSIGLGMTRNAKRSVRTINRREPPRPTIRRVSSYFEYAGAPGDQQAPHVETEAQHPALTEN
jgi:hypothetical protein